MSDRILQMLAQAAQGDAPGALDVTMQVMRGIRRAKVRSANRTIGYFAAAACLLAAAVVSGAFYSWQSMNDPLLALMNLAGPMIR